MKLINTRRVVLVTVLAVAALEISRGLINPFSFDIFADCISGEQAADSFGCEYAPQVMINGIGSLLMAAFSFAFLYRSTRWVKAVAPAAFGVGFLVLHTLVWRFEVSLSDNFQLYAGPETVTEYLYLSLLSLDTVLVGLILGLTYVFAGKLNAIALPETGRRAPRDSLKNNIKNLFKRTAPAKTKGNSKKRLNGVFKRNKK